MKVVFADVRGQMIIIRLKIATRDEIDFAS